MLKNMKSNLYIILKMNELGTFEIVVYTIVNTNREDIWIIFVKEKDELLRYRLILYCIVEY